MLPAPPFCRFVVPVLGLMLGCGSGDSNSNGVVIAGGPRPDDLPVMVNAQPPFRYPPALYARRVQGNVMLRLFIDADGRVLPESTVVTEASGYSALDSAAVSGSESLRFVPAKTSGQAHGVSVIFPVLFRHPDAPPLPGDTALNPRTP